MTNVLGGVKAAGTFCVRDEQLLYSANKLLVPKKTSNIPSFCLVRMVK